MVDGKLGDGGARFENACAVMLLTQVHQVQDEQGRALQLQYIRDKEGREIDFVVSENDAPLLIAEPKLAETSVSNLLAGVAERFPDAKACLVVRHLRHKEQRGSIAIEPAADWLAELSAKF